MPLYADIVLPLATPAPYTYIVPEGMDVKVGSRVIVGLGKAKSYIGIVVKLHDDHPLKGIPRPITSQIDARPVVTRRQIALWQWVADYYMAPIGEVMRQALPLGIRSDNFTPPVVAAVKLTPSYMTEEAVNDAFEILKRSPAGRRALVAYLDMIPKDADGNPLIGKAPYVERSLLAAESGTSAAVIAQLCLKGIFVLDQVPVSQFGKTVETTIRPVVAPYEPTPRESDVYHALEKNFAAGKTTLIHEKRLWDKKGFYRLLIERHAKEGGQILILQPDIASAIALAAHLKEVSATGCIALFHSRLTDHARSSLYYRMADDPGSVQVVVGTRGALFLPYGDLKIIVVESEQSFSYKQSENAPRYNARDVSAVLAATMGAHFILTSEAPSAESYYNTITGKWDKVEFPVSDINNSGISGTAPPVSAPEFMILERGKGLISTYLKKRIGEVIDAGGQVLVFQNRRGFASYIECPECFHMPLCAHCNVTLTYHKTGGKLSCHYCGYTVPYSSRCPSCGRESMAMRGIGTENIEERLAEIFPDVPIARLDYDTTRRSGDFTSIAADFADSKSRILVGTQMIVNGIDFKNVALVAIVNADNMLSAADFRTSERAFQLLTQLSNRIGYNNSAEEPNINAPCKSAGEVIIQTSRRLDPVIVRVSNRDSEGFYADELQQRIRMKYPPAVRMITLTFRHRDRMMVQGAANSLDELLRPVFGSRLSPAYEPPVERTRDEYILEVMLRIERTRSVTKAKAIAAQAVSRIRRKYSSVSLSTDVDPL